MATRPKEYVIYTGTILKIKSGFMQKSLRVMYSGMPDENTFVLSPVITHGYQGYAPNVYYKADAKNIRILNYRFDVVEVTPEHIVLGD